MKIEAMRKPMAGFALVLLLTVALGVVVAVVWRSLHSRTGYLVGEITQEALATERLRGATAVRSAGLAAFIFFGDNGALEEVGRGRDEFDASLNELRNLSRSGQRRARLDQIANEDRQLRAIADEARTQLQRGRPEDAQRIYFTRFKPLRDLVLARIEALREEAATNLTSAQWSYAIGGGRTDLLFWVVLGATLLLTVVIALLYGTAASRLQRRLQHSVEVAEDRERTLRAVLSATADLVFLVDRQHRVRYASFSSLVAVGQTEEELSGMELGALPMVGDMREVVARELDRVLSNGGMRRVEGWCQLATGRAFLEVLITPILSGGRIDAAVLTCHDVTERMQMVQDLRESNRRTVAILESITDAFISMDSEWRYTYVNREAERLFGMSRSVLEGRSMWEMFPDTVGTSLERVYREVVETRRPAHFEEYFPPMKRWLELHAYPSPLGLSVYFRDISERKRIEQRYRVLAEAGALVPESLDYEATIKRTVEIGLGQFSDGSLLYLREDDHLRIEYRAVDPQLEQKFREMLEAYPVTEANDREVASTLRTGEPRLIPRVTEDTWILRARSLEHLQRMRDLQIVSAISVPLRSHSEIIGVLEFGSLRLDRLYDRADLELAIQLANRAAMALENARLYRDARNAIRQREDVVAIVSHDLRNPLNHILLTTQNLLRKDELAGSFELKKPLLGIQRSVEQMKTLLRDLLDFASIQAGRLALDRRPWPVSSLLRDAQEAFEPLTRAKRLRLEVNTASALTVHCDRERVLQVLSNLVGNAIKFSPEGGTIRVEARTSEDGTWANFTVSDAGPGIPPDALPHIFERYWSGGPGAREHGAGLGLSIVKGIVEAHGGRVWVDSAVGRGSRFTFCLPVLRGLPMEAPERALH